MTLKIVLNYPQNQNRVVTKFQISIDYNFLPEYTFWFEMALSKYHFSMPTRSTTNLLPTLTNILEILWICKKLLQKRAKFAIFRENVRVGRKIIGDPKGMLNSSPESEISVQKAYSGRKLWSIEDSLIVPFSVGHNMSKNLIFDLKMRFSNGFESY